MDQTQTPRYVSRFEPLLYVPAFTQKDFHYVHIRPPIQGTSIEKFASTRLGVHNCFPWKFLFVGKLTKKGRGAKLQVIKGRITSRSPLRFLKKMCW